MTTTVVDLSHYNPEPDWDRLKASQIMGVILKATEGTGYVDPTYAPRRREAEAVGLPVVSYHFLKHGNVGLQMLHYLDTVAPKRGERMIIDYEDQASTLADLELAVQTLLGSGLGLQVTVYGGGELKNDVRGHNDVLAKTSLWLAQYGPEPRWPKETWANWTLWQTTDKAQVPGISAPVDGNVFNGTNENLVKWLRPAAQPVPVPIPGPAPPRPELPHVEVSIVTEAGVEVEVWINGKRMEMA
jgi:GH25 family lysozyme M1 (1,4-beta-N-acetylmuramidase)